MPTNLIDISRILLQSIRHSRKVPWNTDTHESQKKKSNMSQPQSDSSNVNQHLLPQKQNSNAHKLASKQIQSTPQISSLNEQCPCNFCKNLLFASPSSVDTKNHTTTSLENHKTLLADLAASYPSVPFVPSRANERLRIDFGQLHLSAFQKYIGLVFFFFYLHIPIIGFYLFLGALLVLCCWCPQVNETVRALACALWLWYTPSRFDRTEYTPVGRTWDAFRNTHLWPVCFNYFPLKVIQIKVVQEEEDQEVQHKQHEQQEQHKQQQQQQQQQQQSSSPDSDYETPKVIVGHPHSVQAFAHFMHYHFLDQICGLHFPHKRPLRSLAAQGIFYVPFLRDIGLWRGSIDASYHTADKALSHGYNIAVLPGGTRELYFTRRNDLAILLKHRQGFIRLALAHDAVLVPVFIFGEKELYRLPRLLPKWCESWMIKHWVPAPFICGRWGTWFPKKPKRRNGLGIVIGTPIHIDKDDVNLYQQQQSNPTDHPIQYENGHGNGNGYRHEKAHATSKQAQQIVDKWHHVYLHAVTQLFEAYKIEFGYDPDEHLIIL